VGVVLSKTKLFAIAATAALLTACQGGQALPPPPPNQTQAKSEDRELQSLSLFEAQNVTTGEKVRVVPTRDAMDAFRLAQAGQRATQATSPLLYHGGPVQVAPQIFVVFWGSSWNNSTGDPNGVGNQYKNFLSIIGGSRWLNSVTQYTQTGGLHVGNLPGSFVAATQSYVDTSSTPPRRPTQSQLAAEAAKAAAHFGINYTANASYVVALPLGIKPSGFGTQYCAYHSSTTAAGHTIAWTNLPYMPDAGASCGAGSVNNPGTLDGVTIVGGHEQAETETDPFPNTGWLDSSNAENGDKCAWMNLENNPNAGGYPTQPLWSNANNGCVQSY
jgi:serine protease